MPLFGKDKLNQDLQGSRSSGSGFITVGGKLPEGARLSSDVLTKVKKDIDLPGIQTKTPSNIGGVTSSMLRDAEFKLGDTIQAPKTDLPDTGFDFQAEEQPVSLFTQEDLPLVRELLDEGFTIEEIKQAKQEELGISTQEPIEKKEPGIVKKTLETPGKIAGAGISQLPKIVSNIGGFFIGKPIDALLEKIGVDAPSLEEQFKADGIETKEKFQEVLGIDPEDFTTMIGEFGSEVGTLLLPGGQAKLISKFPQAADKLKKLGTAIEKVSEKAPRFAATIKSALSGAKEFGKFEIASEGEVTPAGLITGAIAAPVLGATIKGIGKITSGLAEKLELAGLLNPAKLDKVARQLADDGVEDVGAVGEFLLKKGIKGSKENIAKTLIKDAKRSKGAVDSALKKATKESFDDNSQKALKIINESLEGKTGLEDDLLKFTQLSKKLQEKGLNTSEKNSVKRAMDEFINIFRESGDVIAGTTKKGASNVRNGLMKQIEKEAATSKEATNLLKEAGFNALRDANKNTQVSRTLADAILRKDASDQASALINAFAPSGVGAIIGGVGTQGDVFDRLKGVVGGALLGRAVGSTVVKTNIASILNKLSGIEKLALQKFTDTKGVKELGAGLMSKIVNLFDN